jgi:hypothetical protein
MLKTRAGKREYCPLSPTVDDQPDGFLAPAPPVPVRSEIQTFSSGGRGRKPCLARATAVWRNLAAAGDSNKRMLVAFDFCFIR